MTDTSVADTALNTPPPPPAFYESFEDAGVKDWASKSGFNSAEDVAKLAHKFDAFKDADPGTLTRVPGADAKAEDHVALLQRMGAPTEASAYGLDKIEGVDKDLAGAAQTWFQEAGLLPWQAQKIAESQMAWMAEATKAQANADRVEGENELAQLKTEWAGDFTKKIELGKRALTAAARASGLDEKAAGEFVSFIEQGAGTGVALKIASFFGQFVKESDFVDGKAGAGQPDNLVDRWYPNLP